MSLFAGKQFRYLRDESAVEDKALVGSKALHLAELGAQKFPVPSWFVVTTEAFNASANWQDSVDDNDALNRIKPALFYLEVHQDVKAELQEAFSCFDGKTLFAVRSSATDDQGGELESFLCVRAEEVANKIADVWRSAFNEHVFADNKSHSKNRGIMPPAVVVQAMVDADKSGVAFSVDPATGASLSVISSVFGLGESLVSVHSGVDNYRIGDAGYVMAKAGEKSFFCRQGQGALEIIEFDKPETRLSLNDDEARSVAALVQNVAKYFVCPQDIEWAIAGEKLFILQARPMVVATPQKMAVSTISSESNELVESKIAKAVETAIDPEEAFWQEISLKPISTEVQTAVANSKSNFWEEISSVQNVIEESKMASNQSETLWQEVLLDQKPIEEPKVMADEKEPFWRKLSFNSKTSEHLDDPKVLVEKEIVVEPAVEAETIAVELAVAVDAKAKVVESAIEKEIIAVEPAVVVEIETVGAIETPTEPKVATGLEILRGALKIEAPTDPEEASEKLITPTKGTKEKLYIWDNSNIDESYDGITTPLTFSFIRKAQAHTSMQLCRLMGVSESIISVNRYIFSNIFGFIQGRIYYNLFTLYRLIVLFPGCKVNRTFVEYMMGMPNSLPDEIVPNMMAFQFGRSPIDRSSFIRNIFVIGWRFLFLPKYIRRANENYEKTLVDADKDLSQLTLEKLVAKYRIIENKLLNKWEAPSINDFFTTIFVNGLKNLTASWCKDEGGTLQNNLLAEESKPINAELTKLMAQAAGIASQNPQLVETLINDDVLVIKGNAAKYPEFEQIVKEGLAQFGEYRIGELKFESLCLNDDPLSFFRSIGQMALHGVGSQNASLDADNLSKIRKDAETSVQKHLESDFLRTCLFIWVLNNARALMKRKENLRLGRIKLFVRIREIILAMASILHSKGVINEVRDVFYLEINELLDYIEGVSTTTNLNELIVLRKKEIDNYKSLPTPPHRIATVEPIYLSQIANEPNI